jgi:hypothetical protein
MHGEAGGIGVVTPQFTGAVVGRASTRVLCELQKLESGVRGLQLQWSKAVDGSWWQFDQVQPTQLDPYGVFVVWKNGGGVKVSAVLYVGRGSLKDEFARCRRDPAFRAAGVYVTWATVSDVRMLDSIAAYLYQHLRPMWGDVPPLVPPSPVNLPLSA